MLFSLIDELFKDDDIKQKISIFVDPYFSYIKNVCYILVVILLLMLLLQIITVVKLYKIN